MKKRILIGGLALLLVGGIILTVILLTGKGLKTVDNEYLYTLEGEWEGAKNFSEGYAAVKKEGKWGYIDTEGNVVIQPKYDGANSFSEGLAAVQTNGKWGYIDTTGNVVIPFTLQSTFAFSEGLAVYGSGLYYGYLDTTGKAVTPAIYSEASSFRNGIACVKKENRYGFIDKTGAAVTDFVYGEKSQAEEGLIPVFYGDANKGINTGYLTLDGTVALDFLWYDAKPFCQGLAAAKTEYTEPWGFIDKTGTFVIQPQWDEVESFRQGCALVTVKNQYTFINTTGAQITEKTYGKAYSFTEDGLARVGNATPTGYSFGYLNTEGTEVIPLQYSDARDFSRGYAAVSDGKAWAFINKDGTLLCKYLWTDADDFTEEGIARVRSGDVYGFVKLK